MSISLVLEEEGEEASVILGFAGEEEAGELKNDVMDAFALGFLASEAARSTALRFRDMTRKCRVRNSRKDSLECLV